MTVKAISLWQPWASLWAAGIKIHETRDWPTKHRGWLAVHAALKHDKHAAALYDELCSNTDYSDYIMRVEWLPSEFENLPFGAIVGLVQIDACYATNSMNVKYLPRMDRKLGNFSPGRFAWLAEEAYLFKTPIPCKGKQGFFNVEIPDELCRLPSNT